MSAKKQQQKALPKAAEEKPSAIVDCVLLLAKHFELPATRATVIESLPVLNNAFVPELFVRACQVVGIDAKQVTRERDKLTPGVLPCVLVLKDKTLALLTKIEKGAYKITHVDGQEETLTAANLDKIYESDAFLLRVKEQRQETKVNLGWFWRVVFQNRYIYGQVAAAAVLINLFALTSPLFIMNVYDRVVPNDAMESLWVLTTGAVIVFLFDFVLRNLRGYFIDTAGRRADVILGRRLFNHVLDLDLSTQRKSAGAVVNALRDLESLREFFASATLVTLIDLPFVFLFIGVIFLVGGPVGWVPLVATFAILAAGIALQAPMKKAAESAHEKADEKQSVLLETVGDLEGVKSLGVAPRLRKSWEDVLTFGARIGVEQRLLSLLGIHTAMLVQQLAMVGVVVVGVLAIREGNISLGGMIAAVLLTGRTLAPLGQVAQLLVRLHHSMAAFKTISHLLSQPTEHEAGKNYLHKETLDGAIEFRDVTFTYPGQAAPALKEVSFTLKPGEKVALIGRVGSGKSTVQKLLLGLFKPESGNVLADGVDVRHLSPADLRRNIGYVPQDTVLFRGTLRENIMVRHAHANENALVEAANLSCVDLFAKPHPKGYDLDVGERGSQLSGGQRQAVAVARAIVGQPPILLLDEPTSSMDTASENAILTNLKNSAKDQTVVVVTHRSTLLDMVDRVIIMDRGQLVADGPRDKVLKALREGKIKVNA